MSDLEHIQEQLGEILVKVNSIELGVYGDEKNKIPGLIDHQKGHHDRIKSLEESRKKALWYGSGALLTLNALYHFIKDKIL